MSVITTHPSTIVSCPCCTQAIEVPRSLQGQTIACPTCSGDLTTVVETVARAIPTRPRQASAGVSQSSLGPSQVAASQHLASRHNYAPDIDTERDVLLVAPSAKAFAGSIVIGVILSFVYGIGLIILFSVWYRTHSVRYRLTTERLFVQTGLIAKNVEEVELFRVKDQSVRQGVMQRLLGFGSVTVLSTDDSTPRLELVGIKNPHAVKESLRSSVRAARLRGGVRMTEFAQS